jgi:DNA polymerase-3 subunit gamma/tau
LMHIARSDGIEVTDRALFLIAREGEGSMRDAQSLFDQAIAFAGKTVRDEDVIAALGLADRKMLYAVADAIVDRNPVRALELLNELHLFGQDMRRFARELLEHFRNLSVTRLLPKGELLPDLPDEERAAVQKQAQKMSAEDLDRAFRLMLATESDVSRVPYPKLVMEMAVIKLATLTPVLAIEELLDRIDDLERRLGGTGNDAAGPAGPATTSVKSSAATRPQPAARPQPTASDEMTAAVAEAPPLPAGERSWDGFVAFVGKEKVTLLPYVSKSQVPRLDEPVLALHVPRGYYYDYLAQRDHAQLVEELARRYFGRDLRVTVSAVDVGAADTTAAEPAESAAAMQAAALDNPAVRAAVEILGGQVKEVKARARRGREST